MKRVNGVPTVFPGDSGEVAPHENLLKVVFDKGPLAVRPWEDFDVVKQRVASEWAQLPPTADSISASLRAKIKGQMELRGKYA